MSERVLTLGLALALALGLPSIAGCGDGTMPSLQVAGAPLLSVAEGEPFVATISLAPATRPLSIEALTLEVDPAIKPRFDELTIATDDAGLPIVRGQPSCGFVHPGQDRAVVPLRVATLSADATPAELLLSIENVTGAACAPRVTAWLSDTNCASPLSGATAFVAIEPRVEPQTLCVRIESRDPAGEPLTITTTTDLPPPVLGSALPSADAPFVDQTFSIALRNTTPLRGRFTLTHLLGGSSEGSFMSVATTLSIRAASIAGPQLGVEIREQPTAIAEFDVGTISARIWRDPLPSASGASDDDTCLRVELPQAATFVPRAKPSLRWYDAATGRGNPASLEQPYLCGRDFLINVSPPFDAPPLLSLTLTATRCDCAAGTPLPNAIVETRTIAVDTVSLAEPLACTATNGPSGGPATLACADLGQTGELTVVMARDGASCAWGSSGNRFAALSSEVGASDAPVSLATLRVPNPLRNVIVGRFASAPFMRVATRTGSTLGWRSAEGPAGLGWPEDAQVDLDHAVALSPTMTPTAPSVYLAAPSGPSIVLLSLDGTAGASPSFALPSSQPVRGLAAVDLGGTPVPELVVFQNDPMGQALEITVLELDWPPMAAPSVVATHSIPAVELTDVIAVDSAVAQGVLCGTPMHLCQSLFFVATTPNGARLLRLDPAADWASIVAPVGLVTPSEPATIAAIDNHLVAGLRFGIWELSHVAGGLPNWQARDPYLVEQSGTGALVQPAPDYATALAPCLRRAGDPSAVAFGVTHEVARWTLLDDIRIATP